MKSETFADEPTRSLFSLLRISSEAVSRFYFCFGVAAAICHRRARNGLNIHESASFIPFRIHGRLPYIVFCPENSFVSHISILVLFTYLDFFVCPRQKFNHLYRPVSKMAVSLATPFAIAFLPVLAESIQTGIGRSS